MQKDDLTIVISRRDLLLLGAGLAGGVAASGVAALPAAAQVPAYPVSEMYRAARATIANGRELKRGRILLDIPRLAESGNSVATKITVSSPMTAADHVREIVILSERNPVTEIARFKLGPRSGKAEVATNIRLATTQNVHAFAVMSDGSVWTADTEVVVLLAACIDGS